jgi:hypothetical protein
LGLFSFPCPPPILASAAIDFVIIESQSWKHNGLASGCRDIENEKLHSPNRTLKCSSLPCHHLQGTNKIYQIHFKISTYTFVVLSLSK